MTCTRCGSAEAVVKREAAFYCAKCALARDWEEIIALVQEERVEINPSSSPSIDFGVTDGAVGATASETPMPADPFA